MKFLSIVFLIALVSSCNPYPVIKTGLEGNPLPSIDLQLTDSISHIRIDSIFKGKTTVLFYFETFCPFCRAQTEDIIANIKSLKGVQFCLITNSPLKETRAYWKEYKLEQYKNFTVGIDTTSQFTNYFKASSVPYLAIYDFRSKLKRVFIGRTDIDYLTDFLTENPNKN